MNMMTGNMTVKMADNLTGNVQELQEKIRTYEEKKKRFLEWIEKGEPNPVFKRLYKRKFAEIFEES